MNSIKRRLNLGLAGVIFLLGLIFIQSGILVFDAGMRSYFEHDLQGETEYLVSAIVRDNQQGIDLDEERINPVYSRPYSGRYYVIESDTQLWRSRSYWGSGVSNVNQEGLLPDLIDGPNGQKLLMYRADYQRFGFSLKVTIARDYRPIVDSIKKIQYWGVVGICIVLLMVMILQRLLISKALKPLEQTCQEIQQLQQGLRTSLDKEVPVELKPLVKQVNQLLVYTANQLKRSRNSLGNLGHALKTPLAVLLSIMSRVEFNQFPIIKRLMQEQLITIEQLLVRELNKAKIIGDVLPASYFVCNKELPALLDVLRMVHKDNVCLTYQAVGEITLPWNKDDIIELLGNLLDNGCKWAKSKVVLKIIEHKDYYQLLVDDDGPGINPDHYDDVLSRGIRLDEQVTGHGLGLGIVKDMVDSWHGRLMLERSELGGLQVVVTLPKVEPF